ncbi:hypothetical protein QJQ45_010949 [Haematococcus lacustris]|nr:hypothetical protein QJQ45_010949 [Haematococcus lacustris]
MSQRDMQHQAAVDGGALATDGYSPAGEAPPPATRLLDLPPALLDDIACREQSTAQSQRQRRDRDSECYTELLAHALAKLDNCAAVEVCKLVSSEDYHHSHLRCSPGLAQQLLDSFPSLTALTLEGLCVSSDALASLLSHPPLARQLQQLDITKIIVPEGDESGAVGTLFQGLRLKELSLDSGPPGTPLLPSFQPLAQHLTQLHLTNQFRLDSDLGNFMEYLQPLAQLQVLTVRNYSRLNGLIEVLQELPQLHTLQLPGFGVSGHQQLDTLLAATQITSLQLDAVEELDTSYADVPCSWQRLELTGPIKSSGIAYLPLHSLTQPLVLGQLYISVEDISDPEVAAILHHLAEACKVPVQIMEMELEMGKMHAVITPALLQQQRKDLAQLGAFLHMLRFSGMVQFTCLHEVTAADVLALAPLCQDCTHFTLLGGSMEPSLEFWHQLVQLMPAVREVSFMKLEEEVAEVSMERHKRVKQLVVFFGAAGIGTRALPQLYTLQLPRTQTKDQQQCDTLLVATKLTCLQSGGFEKLDTSYADAPCSWLRLELTGRSDWKALAYLPLHSLSQPLVLIPLRHSGVEGISSPAVAAALHNMAYAVKVPVMINCMQLDMLTTEDERSGVITPALLQQQRVDLAQLVALLQPLQCCSAVLIADLHGVTAADILALACMCRDCTHFEVEEDSSIEFWRRMVQLMPAVQLVTFGSDKYVPAAMHESLQFMAEHPWAQWLDITICTSLSTCMLAERQLVQERPFQSQQTKNKKVPAMSQSDMQHQAAVDGSASATDGYSPAGEAPPPATRLLDLPPALLDDIAGRVMQLSARSLLPLTCRAFSQARLLHVPTLRIQLLTPRVVAALQVRTSKLSLTLWQPETEDSEWYDDLLAHTLPKLDKCAAVERLVDSFPGLTALVLSGHSVTSSSLASLLSHPQLSLQLQQLELYSTTVKLPQQPGSGLVTLDPFQGARLKQLRLEGIRCHPPASRRPLPNLQPLAQHLNQLHLKSYPLFGESPGFFGEYLQPLAQLQVLTLSHLNKLQGVTELLQVLPQLHILQLPGTQIKDHQQLDTLLAATQITSLQLRGVEGLDASYADREE